MPQVYEFLIRLPLPFEKREPAWHVILAEETETFGETKPQFLGPLSMAEATRRGFDLATVLGAVEAAAVAHAEAVTAQRDELQTKLERAEQERDAAKADAAAHARLIEALTASAQTATKTTAKKG